MQNKKGLLRIELDVDERQLPEVAALPWEFIRIPFGTKVCDNNFWLGTNPNLFFSRRCVRWNTPKPIQLKPGERLRIALAVANPKGNVKHKEIWNALKELAKSQAEQIELLDLVDPATIRSIDTALEQEPHIFHFIGHAQLKRGKGQIALVDVNFKDREDWINAELFGDLFDRYQPGVVVLQACESAAFSVERPFVGIVSQVIQKNIPVVIAMQYEVFNSTAVQFTLEFYRRLAKGDPVDKATQEGRRWISFGPVGHETRDFATPVLFMSVSNGYLFRYPTRDHELPGLPLLLNLNRSKEKIDLENILSRGTGGAIMIYGHPNAGHEKFKDIATQMMRLRGIEVLKPIDAGYSDDPPDKEFFVSALEDRLGIPREVENVSTNNKKKGPIKEDRVDRLEKIATVLQHRLAQNPFAFIFFALHKTNKKTLHWLWHKVWIKHLEHLSTAGLWMLFFSDSTMETEWWTLSSSVKPGFINLSSDIPPEEVSKFFIEWLQLDQSEAEIRAKHIFESKYPPIIDPDYLYSAMQPIILNLKGGAPL